MTGLRELDQRENDGLVVTLLWSPDDQEVLVEVADERLGSYDVGPVPAACALEAFKHPYAYLRQPEAVAA